MTQLAQTFGTSTGLTLNSTSWTQGTTISSDAVDLSALSPVPVDIQLTVTATVPNSALGAGQCINAYIAISEDGTHFTDNDQYAGANNAQASLRSPTNFYGPFVIPCTQNVAAWGVLSALRQLVGTLPRKFGVVLENQTNVTLTAAAVTMTPIGFSNS